MFIKKFLHRLHESGDWKTLLFHTSWALTLTSGLSYMMGFLRDRIFAQTFGLSRTLDTYNAAFVIPDLLAYAFWFSALSAAFLPIFSKLYDADKEAGFRYTRQMLSWGLLIIGTGVIITIITIPWLAKWLVPGFEPEAREQYILFTRIIVLSPLIFAVSNVYGRMILSLKEFFWYGLSAALYNLGIVLSAVFLVPIIGTIGLAAGTVLAALLHFSVRFFATKRRAPGFHPKLDLRLSPEIKETAKLTAPKVVQYAMWHVMLLNFTRIASKLPEGSVAVYNYARNFQSLPVSLLGIAIALALYTSLSHDAGKGNFKKFKQDFRRDRTRSLVYTTLAAIALAVLAKPLISILLGGGNFGEADVRLLATVLQIYCISIPIEGMLHIYHRSFYSLKNTIIPAASHALFIVMMILIATHLASRIGVYAIPTAFAIGTGAHVSLMATIFPWYFKRITPLQSPSSPPS